MAPFSNVSYPLSSFYQNQNAIKVNYEKIHNVKPKYSINSLNKSGKSINQSKWHHQPFVQTIPGLKPYLIFISFSNMDMMVTTPQICIGEDFCTNQAIYMSSILGNGYRYFILILFIALETTCIIHWPPFLAESRVVA